MVTERGCWSLLPSFQYSAVVTVIAIVIATVIRFDHFDCQGFAILLLVLLHWSMGLVTTTSVVLTLPLLLSLVLAHLNLYLTLL